MAYNEKINIGFFRKNNILSKKTKIAFNLK